MLPWDVKDNEIFQQVITATQQHDTSGSKVLASELVELRKVTKILGNARMGLEQIELRLTTFHDLGDTVVTVMPTIGLMKNMKTSLAKFYQNRSTFDVEEEFKNDRYLIY